LETAECVFIKFGIGKTEEFPSNLNPDLDIDNFNDHFKQRPAFASAVMDVRIIWHFFPSLLTAEFEVQFLASSK
jgi:hypothetical protein